METNKKLKITLGTILIVGIIAMTIVSIGFSMNNKDKPVVAMSRENYQIQTHTIDSLTRVVDSLQMEIHSQAQKFDNTEKKYKEILFEYELGIDRIKNYHPIAYEDFHRILAYREDYSREAEIENKKRLNEYDR
jgi:peptidoglycan hydrolase CwlO-like protein